MSLVTTNCLAQALKTDELRQLILDHLHKEELISYDEQVSSATLELKKLEFQENERARENTLHMKELEAREKELALQVRLKEMKTGPTTQPSDSGSSRPVGFGISKHVRFVPPFQEREIDKYFLHFKKVATSLEWPKDNWTFLLQNILVGKDQEIYAAISLDQSSDYETVKIAVLSANELSISAKSLEKAKRKVTRHTCM